MAYSSLSHSTCVAKTTEDMMKLSKNVSEQMDFSKRELEKEFIIKNWFNLAKISLVRILLFNKKRTGEMGKMLKSDFQLKSKDSTYLDCHRG